MTPIRRAREIGWFLASVVCLGLAIGAVWWAWQRDPTVLVQDRIVIEPTPSVADARAALLAGASDVAQLAWTATADEAGKAASGDVVWSPSKQQGFMRFVGLARNDPTETQYQLWIFDTDRDQDFPVDGGVFDVSSTGEMIPITAKLRVGTAARFAVTVETPGGVVVSDRARIVATATPPSPG